MIKKLRLVIFSLLFLLVLSPITLAANSFADNGGAGIPGNTIRTNGDIPNNVLQQQVPGINGSPTLYNALNNATGVWYMDTSIATNAGSGAPNFSAIQNTTGTYWLILNPGTAGVTCTLNTANPYISVGYTDISSTLNIYVVPSENTATITSNSGYATLYSNSRDSGQSIINIYGGINPNLSRLVISNTNATGNAGVINVHNNTANNNQFNINSANVSISAGAGNVNGAIVPGSSVTSRPNITNSVVRINSGATSNPAFGGSTFNPSINNSVVCCTSNIANSVGSPFGSAPYSVNNSLIISSTQTLGGSISSSIIEQLPVTGSSITFNNTNIYNASSVALTGIATVVGPNAANLTAGITGPTVDWAAPFNNLTFQNTTQGNNYALTIPIDATLNIPQNSSVTVGAPSRASVAGNVNDIGEFNYYYFDGEYGDVFSVNMNGNAPTFYNSTSNNAPAYQSANVGLSTSANLEAQQWSNDTYQVVSNLNTNVYPWNLNWTLNNFNANPNAAPIATLANSNEPGNPTTANAWTLIPATPNIQIYGVEERGFVTPSHNGVRLFSPLDENGNPTTEVYLLYNGYGLNTTNKLNPSIYTLTAQFPQTVSNFDLNGAPENPSYTLNFNVENSDVANVTILNANNETFNNPLTVDLNNGRTYQFNYMARNSRGDVVSASDANWVLSPNLSNGVATSNYAVINEDTGLITFIQPLPQNVYMTVNLSVDGVQASPSAIIRTTGSLPVQEITGIAPIVDPISAYSGNAFYPISNLEFTPLNTPVTSNVTFTSSNSAILVRPATTTNGGLSLVAPSPTYTGSTTVTATYTDGTNTYTTSYVVNFSPTATGINGVTAAENLDFVLTAPTVQNVNAKYTPENATVNSIADYTSTVNGSTTVKNLLNLFTYTSANTSIATVDSYGNVTPIAVGTTTVTTTYTVPGTNTRYSTTTTINIQEAPVVATSLTLDKSIIYLAPEGTENGTTSAELTATVEPENVDLSELKWESSSENISIEADGLTATVTADDTNCTGTITVSIPGADGQSLTATCEVVVSDQTFIVDSSKTVITASSPDYFTVTVAPIVNPAITTAANNQVQQVSIFCWSELDQTDINAKEANNNGNGTYSYEFPVNDTPVNNYFDRACDISVNCYASTVAGENGDLIWSPTWNYDTDCGWPEEVVATPYVQNTGFITPSVGNGAVAGTTGQNTQMEGIRLATPIEGVDVVYDVHVENVGWMPQVEEGVYAGTMHQNLQMEAIHIRLTGANASQYTVQYQAHVQNIGWQNWVSNGQEAGTTGQGLQMEALRVQIVPANTPLPTN